MTAARGAIEDTDAGFGPDLVPMTAADIDAVCGIEKRSFSSPWPEEHFRYAVSNPRVLALTARDGEIVVGYTIVYFGRAKSLIANLAVRREYRRRGVASKLLTTVLQEADRRGCLYASLDVRKSNRAAIRLYEKFGFRVFGERAGYYSSPSEDALTMTRTLPGS